MKMSIRLRALDRIGVFGISGPFERDYLAQTLLNTTWQGQPVPHRQWAVVEGSESGSVREVRETFEAVKHLGSV